ncbi:B-box zinc finger protein 22 [Striga hermonthica]|uniref:B-box zinc finger protein 22 n=1 Tax=Striga hermonthica TaxID=68872 RepID=A0A9N7R344_STRHE|nr:B-box zinc finger protein 22 [Striga hermonthica]
MKIQCNVCESAEAGVLCCADEAALCLACDRRVHAANKLAIKHQRVPLSDSSVPAPKCDICQDSLGFFFCLQDRALLCRKCDLSIHTVNPAVSTHRRFLLTGVRVGLPSGEDVSSSSKGKTHSLSTGQTPGRKPRSFTNMPPPPSQSPGQQVQSDGQNIGNMAEQGNNLVGDFTSTMLTYAGGSVSDGNNPAWPLDEFLDLSGYNNFMDSGSSKV